ncbi:MAG: helical backbone metal receptor, partial [Bacteroidota bacterium]
MSWLGPDRDGLPSPLATPPRRIVSLVPSQTELLAALGLDAETVGLTRFCVHPADWKARKQIIGGTKNVRVDRVRQLAPDLVIANKEENVREQVEAIAAFAPVWVTD